MVGHLTEEQIKEVLRENILGRLGCHDGQKNYIVPLSYLYDEKNILAHSAMGLKIQMMRKNPQVCFQVDEIKNYTSWKSVILWGRYEELEDEADKYYTMKAFVDRMLHLKLSETAIPPEISENRVHPRSAGNIKLVVYRIVIDEMTGRFENNNF